MLNRKRTILVVIDVQEKLAAIMREREAVERNIERLIRGCHILGIPAIHTEQYPQGLGPTSPAIQRAFGETGGSEPVQKMSFSAHGSAEFLDQLGLHRRKQVLLAGIEAHVCVYQTAMDLLRADWEVHVVTDAVTSRTTENRQLALERMREEGAKLTSTEMALFELTERAGTEEFRAISKLVK